MLKPRGYRFVRLDEIPQVRMAMRTVSDLTFYVLRVTKSNA